MANLNLSQFTEKTFVADADWVFVWDAANTISKKVSRNSLLNSGTLATSAPVTISQTWSTTDTYTAVKVVATETATAATASNLLELWSGSTPALKVHVNKGGSIISKVGVIASNGSPNAAGLSLELLYSLYGLGVDGNGSIVFFRNGVAKSRAGLGIAASSDSSIGWTNSTHVGIDATLDTILVRDGAANTLALRNSTAAQTFNVYGTFTTATTNFERLAIKYNGSDFAYQIAAEKGSTNGDYRPLDFVTGGSRRMTIGTNGNVGIGTTAPAAKLQIGTHTGAVPSGTVVAVVGAVPRISFSSNDDSVNYGGYILSNYSGGTFMTLGTRDSNVDTAGLTLKGGNVGIGTTAPSSKLHVEGGTSPTITLKNTSATGYGQLLFQNTVVSGTGFWLNGSTQTGYGGANSLNAYSSDGPIAFHTATVTNALSIAQNGTSTHAGNLIFAPDNTYDIGANGANRPRNVYVGTGVEAGVSFTAGSRLGLASVSGNAIVTTYNSSPLLIGWNNGIELVKVASSTSWMFTSTVLVQFGGTTASFPALKRSTTYLQARLADDSAFAPIQGKLTTDTAYTGTTVVPTGFITLYDSTGTAYKVPCVAA